MQSDPESESASTGTKTPRRRRKPSYQVVKEEKTRLLDEIETLEGTLCGLQEQRAARERDDAAAQGLNSQLKLDVQRAWALIAQWTGAVTGALPMQALVATDPTSPMLDCPPGYDHIAPLTSAIHLPMDEYQRHAALSAIAERKFDVALELIVRRSDRLDLTRFHQHTEASDLANGDFVMVRFDVTPLERATSVQQALCEMISCIGDIDVTLSANLGIVATRQTDDCAEMAASQCRMLATEPTGVQVESNVGMFVKYFDHSPYINRPHALLVVDNIDADDRHPYQPMERIRRDVTAAVLLTTAPRAGDGLPVVTMVRWIFARLHNPQFTVSEQARLNVRDIVEKWCDVLPTSLVERLGSR